MDARFQRQMEETLPNHPEEYFPAVNIQVAELPDTLTEPVAYHLRFTFSDQDRELNCLEDKDFINRCRHIHKSVIQEFRRLDYIFEDRYTSGFETHNKKGETCPAHFHLIFYSTKNSESMRRKLKRYLSETYDQGVTGNKALSFKPQIVRSKTELWRYPLKQSLKYDLCNGFSPDELKIMHECAKESYLKTVQINQAKADKADNSDTLFARVLEKIKKLELNDTITPRIIAKQFLEQYVEEDRPINIPTIKGYVLNASIKIGITSIDDVIGDMGY